MRTIAGEIDSFEDVDDNDKISFSSLAETSPPPHTPTERQYSAGKLGAI